MVRVYTPAMTPEGWELNPRSSTLSNAPLKAVPAEAKQHNRTLIAQTLYRAGAQSRADLARATGLTKVTVSTIVAELLAEGLVEELGLQPSIGPGKPATLVDLARSAHAVIALDLSDEDLFRGAVLDLTGRILLCAEAPRHVPARGPVTGDAATDLVVELTLALREQAGLPLLGLGIGTPGVIDDQGFVRSSQNLGWESLPLRDILEERIGLPTSVQNDANLAALAEHSFGNASDSFALVRIGYGVGAGIVLEGRPITGRRFASGEIGHVLVSGEPDLAAPHAREQVLEHWLSVPALRAALGSAGAGSAGAGTEGTVPERAGTEGGATDARTTVLRNAGISLGTVLAPVVGMLSLDEIVLAGPPELLEGALAEAALGEVIRRTMPESHDRLAIRLTDQGDALILRGAAALVLRERLGLV